MLEIHPLTDPDALSEYINLKSLPQDSAVLRAYENGETTGNIALTLETRPNAEGAMRAFLLIRAFEYPDDFTGELMLRAAASFAFNHMVPEVRAEAAMHNELFDRVGFEKCEEYLSIATHNVVHFCK